MKILSILFCTIFATLTTSSVLAKGDKRPPLSVTFHLESSEIDDAGKFTIPVETELGKKYIQKVPSFFTKNFTHYHTFVSPHPGEKYGISLQLDAQNKGRYLVANVQGSVVDMIYIDRQVDGRVLTIWRNIDPEFFGVINNALPKIGETDKQWKDRLKQEKKDAKAKK